MNYVYQRVRFEGQLAATMPKAPERIYNTQLALFKKITQGLISEGYVAPPTEVLPTD